MGLWLAENQLESLPSAIGNLPELELLWLDKNRLTYLPRTIGKLKSLRELQLTDNRLKDLPAEIGELADLEILYLERNQITYLPSSVQQLSKLKTLFLDDNPITDIDLNHLKPLKNLRALSLFGTKVSYGAAMELQRHLPNCEILIDPGIQESRQPPFCPPIMYGRL